MNLIMRANKITRTTRRLANEKEKQAALQSRVESEKEKIANLQEKRAQLDESQTSVGRCTNK